MSGRLRAPAPKEGGVMKQFLLATGALMAFLVGPAMAADMPAKAPVYKAAPAIVGYDWGGFYVGGHVGGAWSANGAAVGQAMTTTFLASPPLSFSTNGNSVIGGLQ